MRVLKLFSSECTMAVREITTYHNCGKCFLQEYLNDCMSSVVDVQFHETINWGPPCHKI